MGSVLASRAMLAVRHPATIVAAVMAAMFGIAVLINPGTWATFTAMAAGDRETLRQMILAFGALAPLASITLNVLQAVIAPIPGFVVPFVNGAVFGTWWGMLITWAGGVAAAATCFGIARTFGRGFAERICSQFRAADEINRKLEKHAFAAIILGRFVPGVPFDFLSYFVGLTRVRFTSFIVATAVGSAPHAYVYAFMGSSLHIPLWIGVLMTPALGLAYAAVRWAVRAIRRGDGQAVTHAPAAAGVSWPAAARNRRRPAPVGAPAPAACMQLGACLTPGEWAMREPVPVL